MKKFIVLVITLVLVVVGVCIFIINKQPDSGIDDVSTYDEYVQWLKKQELSYKGYIGGEQTEEDIKEFYTDNEEKLLEVTRGISPYLHYEFCAIIVEAGDMYKQYDNTFEQSAVIKEVIEGCKYQNGTEITIVQNFGTNIDEDGNVELFTGYGKAPLIPGDKYIVFCEETELSSDLDKPQFRILIGSYSYLSLSNNNVTVVDENTTVEEVLNSEFITTSMLDAPYLLDLKQKVFDYYDISMEE